MMEECGNWKGLRGREGRWVEGYRGRGGGVYNTYIKYIEIPIKLVSTRNAYSLKSVLFKY